MKLLPVFSFCCLLVGLAVLTSAEEKPHDFDRWEPSIRKFEAQAKADPPKKEGVLFIGSSSIRMWDLEKWFPGQSFINHGFGGSEIVDSNHFADRILFPHSPRTIVMYAGDNDIAKGRSPEGVASDFATFVKTVHSKLPKTKIVYVAVKPSLARWNLVVKVRDANQRIQKQTKKHELLEFIDIDTPMLGEDGKPRKELFLKDGLHLSDAGYQIWVDLVKPHLPAE